MRLFSSDKQRSPRYGIVVFTLSVLVFQVARPQTVSPNVTYSTVKQMPDSGGVTATQSNQQALGDNQSRLIQNQNALARNQSNMNDNVESWLSNAITEQQMETLLLDDDITKKGYDNLVDQLKFVFSHASDVQASAYVDQAVSAFESAAQSSTMSQARSDQMANFVSLILSGAGNENASETLWVSDVIDGVSDPSDTTISTYNAVVYPYVDLGSDGTSYQVSECSKSVETLSCGVRFW